MAVLGAECKTVIEVSISHKAPGYRDRVLALNVANHIRHRMLGRNADAHVDMVWHQMAFHDPTLPLPRQLMQHLTQMLPDRPEDRFLAPLRNESGTYSPTSCGQGSGNLSLGTPYLFVEKEGSR